MSRSLSPIRHLISEIEEIQRQGQQGPKATKDWMPVEVPPEASVRPKEQSPSQASFVVTAPPESSPDPFDEITNLVDLDTKRNFVSEQNLPGKIFLQLSGHVALSLQIADSNETVELRQVGNMIEIRFADGKAFHIPFKAVA